MNPATTLPNWRAGGTLASAAGALLAPRLAASAGDFTPGLGIVRAQVRIRHLANVSLVHQIHVNWGFEDLGGQFYRPDLLAFHVENVNFHSHLTPMCINSRLDRLLFARFLDND
jgi:hypothetical protein